jgi:hypothetical protein
MAYSKAEIARRVREKKRAAGLVEIVVWATPWQAMAIRRWLRGGAALRAIGRRLKEV